MPQLQTIEQDWSSTAAHKQCGMETRLTGLLGGILPFMYFVRFEKKNSLLYSFAYICVDFRSDSIRFFNNYDKIIVISFNGAVELA